MACADKRGAGRGAGACELLRCSMDDMPFGRTDGDPADCMAGDSCSLFLEAEVTLSDGTVLTDADTFVPYKHMDRRAGI